MRKLVVSLFLVVVGISANYAQEINEEELLSNLEVLSADDMKGRGFGTAEGKQAAEFVAKKFKEANFEPAFEDSYFQQFYSRVKGRAESGNNIAAVIPGKTNKIIVVTAHIDHLGVINGKIFNGADDNASGTAALITIGRYFQENKPDHTIFLAAVDAEETGSQGAQYLLDNFPLKKNKIVLNVNLDMIAHNDNNELYASGTYFYPEYKQILAGLEVPVKILFGHDSPEDKGGDNWTYSSDHRIFHRADIPFIYFGVEDHKDYHKATDVYANINKAFYTDAVQSIIAAIEAMDDYL